MTHGSAGSSSRPSPARPGEGRLALVLSVLAIVVPGFALPGLGIAIAAALAFTAYRGDRRLQLTLLVIGVVVTVLSLLAWVLALGGDTTLERDPAVRVRP